MEHRISPKKIYINYIYYIERKYPPGHKNTFMSSYYIDVINSLANWCADTVLGLNSITNLGQFIHVN